MTSDALLALSAVELRRLIGSRDVSPVELLSACIARIEALNPSVNAVAAVDYAAARRAAHEAEAAILRGERLGPLHGLPVGIKDLEETAGLLTTYGSPLYRDAVPAQDNVLVARLRAAGAIVVGKTNTPEFGAGANTRNPVWGATGNPFNPDLNAGGSSGGSAAALACDMLPICTGSDTGGSLRIPAALCGVAGFRPSPGLVPSSRRTLGWSPLPVPGPMGREVADMALQLVATAGLDARDPLSYEVDGGTFAALRPLDPATLRIGWTEDFGVCDVDDDIRRTFRARIEAIRPLVARCEPVAPDFADAHRAFDVLRAENFLAGMREIYERDPALLGPNSRTNYELGAAMTLADAAWAHDAQTALVRRFQPLYEEFDAVVSPVTPVSPFPWTTLYAAQVGGRQQASYYRWLALTYVVTLLTHPAAALPCGVDEAGMPFGLQVIGPFRQDRRTLEIAQALEGAFAAVPALRRPRPDLARLAASRADPPLKSIVTAPPPAGAGTGAAGA